MNWDTRRKVSYALAVIIFLVATSIYFFRDTLFKDPTCFDRKQNGFEIGVDCGGTCSLKCSQEVSPLVVKWSRSMKTGSSTYDLVAMITNKNIDNASRSLAYRFTLYDNEGNELGRHTGSITPPIDGDFPIILQNINVEKGIVSRVVTDLLDQPHYAVRSKPKSPTIKVTGTRYEPGQVSRVYAFINNTKQVELENIPVKVILFDISDNAYAVGDTIVPYLGKEESVSISFLWPYQFRDPPAKIRIYPLLDPFNVNQ